MKTPILFSALLALTCLAGCAQTPGPSVAGVKQSVSSAQTSVTAARTDAQRIDDKAVILEKGW